MELKVIKRFGPGQCLTGVLEGPRGKGPILLLPSAGLQPRAGPFRLHAMLAERLAAAGVRTFRFDVPGVGEAPHLSGFDAKRATLAAIDHLEAEEGCSTFAVGGICSAADTGWNVAIADARVSAILLLDGICYAGPWFHYARTIDRIRRAPTQWRRVLGKVRLRMRGNARGLDPDAFRTWPTPAEAKGQFARLVERNVRMLWIFSGGYASRFMHPRQFHWTFGDPVRAPGVTMLYWPDCDHTYFGREQRERLIGTIEHWMLGSAKGGEDVQCRAA